MKGTSRMTTWLINQQAMTSYAEEMNLICVVSPHSQDGEAPFAFLLIVVAHTKPYDKPYTTLCCGHQPSGIHIICQAQVQSYPYLSKHI